MCTLINRTKKGRIGCDRAKRNKRILQLCREKAGIRKFPQRSSVSFQRLKIAPPGARAFEITSSGSGKCLFVSWETFGNPEFPVTLPEEVLSRGSAEVYGISGQIFPVTVSPKFLRDFFRISTDGRAEKAPYTFSNQFQVRMDLS